jgi:hypothetical protein
MLATGMSNAHSMPCWVRSEPQIPNDGQRANPNLPGMTDPTAQEDMVPPPKPPRPSQPATSTTQRQLEADEQYARQLAKHYNAPAAGRRGPAPGWENDPRYRQPRGSEDSEEKDYSFFEGN